MLYDVAEIARKSYWDRHVINRVKDVAHGAKKGNAPVSYSGLSPSAVQQKMPALRTKPSPLAPALVNRYSVSQF
ncbi:hypothetical protein C8J56DRAFT_1042045 [Mycena floridula]|nr:hypothetical protein C8J56DRAFT_1042045 [Mycena floridula]